MPRTWTAKDERMYEHIVDSCLDRGRSEVSCKRMAAATVNKRRRAEGRTLSSFGQPGSGSLLVRIAMAAGAGAAAAGLVWWVAKKELERDFGSGAEELSERFRRAGAALEEETRVICSTAAEQAVRSELASMGITPSLIRDTSRTLGYANELVEVARRAGVSIQTLLRRLDALF